MPSIRLLSMVYDMTKSKHFKWIPWQLRLSARQYQEAMEARSHKVARTEAQLVTHAFFDETPEVKLAASHSTSVPQCIGPVPSLGSANRQHVPHAARPHTVPAHSHDLRTLARGSRFGAQSCTFCIANGPWTTHSMNSRMAAWRSIRSLCCDLRSQSHACTASH